MQGLSASCQSRTFVTVKGGYAAKECAFIYGTGLCIIAVVRPNVFDGLGSLERWVENGRPTRPILATKLRRRQC